MLFSDELIIHLCFDQVNANIIIDYKIYIIKYG